MKDIAVGVAQVANMLHFEVKKEVNNLQFENIALVKYYGEIEVAPYLVEEIKDFETGNSYSVLVD